MVISDAEMDNNLSATSTGPFPLSDWMCRRDTGYIAFRQNEFISVGEFKARVWHWYCRLISVSDERCAVYHSDCAEFFAILNALWQLKKTACVPGDNRPGTVERLSRSVNLFLGEFPALNRDAKLISNVDYAEQNDDPDANVWQTCDRNFPALEIYTSGSTGEPTAITKTLTQLDNEVDILRQTLPDLSDAIVLTTVSHQHFYGMTFRLFLPACLGVPFDRDICEYPEEIIHRTDLNQPVWLISSPSHLTRLPDRLEWGCFTRRCLGVVSSAAPLSRQDSLRAQGILQCGITEIYGSSETGAIAYRVQRPYVDDAPWQPLPRVQVECSGQSTLRVCSPYTDNERFETLADKVSFLSDGTFRLSGRIDRIVKIEGKRISLTAIEKALLVLSEISAVKALLLERKRTECAVVIELSSEGQNILEQIGKRGLVQQLKGRIADDFERVALPRRWRFVPRMPYNSQGKLPLSNLLPLFDNQMQHSELSKDNG